MFDAMIRECEARLTRSRASWRRRLGLTRPEHDLNPKDQIVETLRPHYLELLNHGRVVWGSIVMANVGLYRPGVEDLFSDTVFSPTEEFDSDPLSLLAIAHAVFELKDTAPARPDLGRVAAIISDEHNIVQCERLPAALAGRSEVYLSTTLVHRSRLPGGVLSGRILPFLICPERTEVNMILPLRHWAESLVQHWGELNTLAPPGYTPRRVTVPPQKRVASKPRPANDSRPSIVLTQAAADRIREIIRENELPEPVYLRIHPGPRMEFVINWDKASQQRIVSRGIPVLIDRDDADALAGTLLDFQTSVYGAGFTFRNQND